MLRFTGAILRLARTLPKDLVGRHVVGQIVRCATSAGANYEEARAAESRPDFIHKLGVAQKEVRETSYWLSVIIEGQLSTADLAPLVSASFELSAILGASIRTARAGDR